MIVGLEITSDFGHFSHPSTIYSSLSYPIPPKTTIMGMIGAIMGEDNYLFLNAIKHACVVKKIEGKRNFCFNGIKDALKELNLEKVGNGFTKGRKQFYRELLVSPTYELYIDISALDEGKVQKLIQLLQERKSMYQLYMGINFCLASYQFLGTFHAQMDNAKQVHIDSIIPLQSDFEIEMGKNYTDIRCATTIEEGRIFGGFSDFLVETSGQAILCNDIVFYEINNRKVVFI
ncbi:MAG: CRISPR-associated protein Cas5 [Campylobacterales bacterium]|nr:CRISPR-associated protein Cas5 [Campylobacterales bacterium]